MNEHKSSASKPVASRIPQTGFLFIANELPTNDNPDVTGSVEPVFHHGRWRPPIVPGGFYPQVPGLVYRWKNGVVSQAIGYEWSTGPVGHPPYANGAVICATGYPQPEYYRAATVFYCNHFDKFFAAVGDAGTRDMIEADPIEDWHPLSFRHENNISYVDHVGDQHYLAVRQASWIQQLLPNTYRYHEHDGPDQGGLAGLLPLLIALIAFSCPTQAELRDVLLEYRAWSGRSWDGHPLNTGRREHRGMVVSVFTDPEDSCSTPEALVDFENGDLPIFT